MQILGNLQEAVEWYYSKTELQNEDIKKLFGVKGNAKVADLKAKVKEEMAKRNIPSWSPYGINTYVAYEVWGFDIKDLEKRLKKLQELKNREVRA